MFLIKRKMHEKIVKAKENEITVLKNKIETQKLIISDLKEEIEYEHLENYKNHKKLLAIRNLLKKQDYGSFENFKNRLRTIMYKKELDPNRKPI